MIILKTGKIIKPLPEWVGKRFKCSKCTGIFELEEKDPVITEKSPDGKRFFICPTPDCREKIDVRFPYEHDFSPARFPHLSLPTPTTVPFLGYPTDDVKVDTVEVKEEEVDFTEGWSEI